MLAPGWLTVSPVKLFIAAYSPEHCLHTNSTSCSAILWPLSATTAYDIANTSYMLLHECSLNHLYILNSIKLICIVGRCDGLYLCISVHSIRLCNYVISIPKITNHYDLLSQVTFTQSVGLIH